MNILLVEDDAMLGQAIRAGLVQNKWAADIAVDAAAARCALANGHGYDAVLLDLQLPGASGLSVLAALRAAHDATPVLIITGRDRLQDRVLGLDSGADDYLVKPFQPEELYARLRALSRRSQGRVTDRLEASAVSIDPATRTVWRDGLAVPLSLREYRTLLALMERRPRVVSREQLELLVYGSESEVESNTIAVYVHQLRRKLGDAFITTVHGFGYCINEGTA